MANKIIGIVIMIVIIVALVYLIPRFSGDVVQSIPCTDSDGGKIYTVQGDASTKICVEVKEL